MENLTNKFIDFLEGFAWVYDSFMDWREVFYYDYDSRFGSFARAIFWKYLGKDQ